MTPYLAIALYLLRTPYRIKHSFNKAGDEYLIESFSIFGMRSVKATLSHIKGVYIDRLRGSNSTAYWVGFSPQEGSETER
jgi:hypothetical protein